MSSVYVLEPPTKGKVVLNTSLGPLDIELWPKEAPKAVRNFVQLCLEGYFDQTIFHRVIKSFLVQGGDPTGTGTGGESIYGGPFADEFHSRLRFNHRGLVACANAGSPNSNGSQFFISLDRCDWLERKNTIFGKVTGDSIYNLLRFSDVETDKDDRPIYPAPKILSVEVLWNPFDDIVPRQGPEKLLPQTKSDDAPKEQKQKAIKKLNVLSFGDEVEEEEKESENMREKIKSIHDVLDDPRFLKGELMEDDLKNSAELEKKKEIQRFVRGALASKRNDPNKDKENYLPETFDSASNDEEEDEAKFDARMRSQILKRRRELGDIDSLEKLSTSSGNKSTKKETVPSPRNDDDGDDYDGPTSKVEKFSIKKKGIGSEARAEQMAKADSDLQLLSHAEQERQLQKQKKRRLHGREEDEKELGRVPTMSELHTRTHQSQRTKDWIDEPARLVNEEYLRLRELQSQASTRDGSSVASSQAPSDFDLWTQAVGGKKKGRTYGLGAQGPSFDAQGLYTSSQHSGSYNMHDIFQQQQDLMSRMHELEARTQQQEKKHQDEMLAQQAKHQLEMTKLLKDLRRQMDPDHESDDE